MGIVGRFESSAIWVIGFGARGLALPAIRRVMRHQQREPCHDAWDFSILPECQQPVHFLCRSSGPHYWGSKVSDWSQLTREVVVPSASSPTVAHASRRESLINGHGCSGDLCWGDSTNRRGCLGWSRVLLQKLAHVGLAQRDGDTIDASFNARAKVMSLKSILCTKLTSALGDCNRQCKPSIHKPLPSTYFQAGGCQSRLAFGSG